MPHPKILIDLVTTWNDVETSIQAVRRFGLHSAHLNVPADVDDLAFARMVLRLDDAKPAPTGEMHRAAVVGRVDGCEVSLGLLRQ